MALCFQNYAGLLHIPAGPMNATHLPVSSSPFSFIPFVQLLVVALVPLPQSFLALLALCSPTLPTQHSLSPSPSYSVMKRSQTIQPTSSSQCVVLRSGRSGILTDLEYRGWPTTTIFAVAFSLVILVIVAIIFTVSYCHGCLYNYSPNSLASIPGGNEATKVLPDTPTPLCCGDGMVPRDNPIFGNTIHSVPLPQQQPNAGPRLGEVRRGHRAAVQSLNQV